MKCMIRFLLACGITLALLLVPLEGLAAEETAPSPAPAQEVQDEGPMEEGTPFEITSPSAILMEASTGRVIFEKDADDRRPGRPA